MRQDEISPHLGRLAFCFFYRYSRFEFALKANGYLKSSKLGSPAEPDWREFAKKRSHDYCISAEAEELISVPPKRQIVAANKDLVWEDVDLSQHPSDLEQVIRLLQIVRNNLFHGGKVGEKGWDDSARTELLLKLSVVVLDQIAKQIDFEADYLRRY